MKTNKMARDYLFRAKWCLKEAEMALSGEKITLCALEDPKKL